MSVRAPVCLHFMQKIAKGESNMKITRVTCEFSSLKCNSNFLRRWVFSSLVIPLQERILVQVLSASEHQICYMKTKMCIYA